MLPHVRVPRYRVHPIAAPWNRRYVPLMNDLHYYETVVEQQGAEFQGIQMGPKGALILFADPKLRTTLAIAEPEFSPEAVSRRLQDSRHTFASKS